MKAVAAVRSVRDRPIKGWMTKRCGALVFLMVYLAAAWVGAQQEQPNLHLHTPAATAMVELQDDPAAHVVKVRLGPFQLPSHADHPSMAQASDFFLNSPFDAWFLSYQPQLVDDTDTTLPGRLLHHAQFFNASRINFLCPKGEEWFFSAGGEMKAWPAIPGFGYRVAKGDRIRISAMFHNPTVIAFSKVYLEVQIAYRPAGDSPPLKNVYPTWISVGQCGELIYDLKPGRNVTASEFTFGYGGLLLGLGGHLHDYGRELRLENVTRNKEIATFNATLDSQGHIVSVPIVFFHEAGGYRLNRGEIVKVTAVYQNPTGTLLPQSGMGMVVGYFLPDKDEEFTALTRNSK